MIKYVPEMTSVVLEEIPGMVTLAVDISNCRGDCDGCHSPFLKKDVGEALTEAVIDKLIADNFGINCFLFMGEGQDLQTLSSLAMYIKKTYRGLKIALYSGRGDVEGILWEIFDYIKVGPYVPACGPLNKKTTNQRLYRIENGVREDITHRFWHRGIDKVFD